MLQLPSDTRFGAPIPLLGQYMTGLLLRLLTTGIPQTRSENY